MNELDTLYRDLTKFGLSIIRNTLHGTDQAWALAQAEFIHEVPGLIGNPDASHHISWWDDHRKAYFDWMTENESAEADEMREEDLYGAMLAQIEPHIEAMRDK